MRILSVSNFYPPNDRGGYEQSCAEVSAGLAARGHEVHVLTATVTNLGQPAKDGPVRVHRALHLEVVGGLADTIARLLLQRRRLERENLLTVRALLNQIRPDVVLLWGLWNVPRSVPAELERLLHPRVAYYFCDYWPTLPSAFLQQLQEPARRLPLLAAKRLVGWPLRWRLRRESQLPLRVECAACVSRSVRARLSHLDVVGAQSAIVHQGINVDDFSPTSRDQPACGLGDAEVLRLVYVGRLESVKGVHTAIRAMAALADLSDAVRLDIVGRGDAAYEQALRTLTRELDLERQVCFRGPVAREKMPEVLARYNVLVFPSEWDEPLARTPMEAMAAGLAVVGTTTGGSGELLRHEDTALTFAAGDPADLAMQIRRLANDRSLHQGLAQRGQALVRAEFTIEHMIGGIEALLLGCLERSGVA